MCSSHQPENGADSRPYATETQKTAPEATSEAASAVLSGGTPAVPSDQATVAELFDLSIPKIGAYRTEDHQYYWNRQGPFPGATTVLDVMQKWGIYYGGLKKVAMNAIYRWEELGALLMGEAETTANVLYGTAEAPASPQQILEVGGPDSLMRKNAVQKWLAALPDRDRDAAAKIGTHIHTLVNIASGGQESDGEGFIPSDVEIPFLEAYKGFLAFLVDHRGTVVSSEKMVWSEDGYAGTYDALIRFECECHQGLWLTDTKTSATGPYPEWALQLIAYGTADWIIVEGNPMGYPMPIVQRYGVLHLRPDLYTDTGWRLIEYPLIPSDRMGFLGLLEAWRWKEQKRYTKSALAKAQKG